MQPDRNASHGQLYLCALLASLQRQLSTQVIGWLDRTQRTSQDVQRSNPIPLWRAEFATAQKTTQRSPLASDDCKAFAQACLDDLR